MRQRLLYIASALILVAATALGTHFIRAPKTLKIAVGPMGSTDLRVAVAFLQALQRDTAQLRLRLVLTDGSAASAKAIEDDKADLAIVRSDVAMPPDSATIAIMRRDAVFFITRPGSDITRMADLRGKRIGVASSQRQNDTALGAVLSYYGLGDGAVEIFHGTQEEIALLGRGGLLDALFVIAPSADPRGARIAARFFPEVAGQEPDILPITEAEAIARLLPKFDTVEIVRGAFGGDPPRPAAPLTTLAVTHRLIADRTLDETQVSELTRLLFALRPSMVAEVPAANQIELPITDDRGAKLPTHAGTIAYVEGETKSFFDRYGDWIYLGIMGFSLVGSVVAAMYSRMSTGRSPADIDRDLAEVARLIAAIRNAEDGEALAAITGDAARARADLVQLVAEMAPDSDKIAAIDFLLRQLREQLEERRKVLAVNSPQNPPVQV